MLQARPKDARLASKSENLWALALDSLSDNQRALVEFGDSDWLSVLNSAAALADDKRKQCLQKRWSIKVFGRKIILRDVFAKITRWIQKFKEVGDIVVQYDPAHAALPWAGVRLLLQVAINENQISGAMIESLEWITSIIPFYAVLESIYLKESTPAVDGLRDALVTLYSAILCFLAKAIHHFDKRSSSRLAKSLLTFTETTIEAMWKDYARLDSGVVQAARLVDAERQGNIQQAIERMSAQAPWEATQSQLDLMSLEQRVALGRLDPSNKGDKIWQLSDDLKIPISRISEEMQKLYDNLSEDERTTIYHWLSITPYSQHHQNARKGRLYESGNWLLEHPRFQGWASTSYSSILWIHGIPGSGKSKLISRVVDHLLVDNAADSGKAPIAYFYCSKDHAEPERADPEKILLSITRQLSGTDVTKPIREATLRKFSQIKREGFQLRKLSLDETVDLILELTSTSPATIVLDALDECSPDRRYELFDSLNKIVQGSSNIVKVLISSRDDGDIVCQLETSPNVYISVDHSSGDIRRFVEHEVSLALEKKRLLNGRISEESRQKIIRTLQEGAQGMFRWVSLQLQNLCNPRRIKIEADLLEELGRLPQGLHEAYQIIYRQILDSGKYSRSVGVRVLQWLQIAQRPLRTNEVKAAVLSSGEESINDLTTRDILNMTCNLVVEDTTLDCLRYAHISVLEFLERHPDFIDSEMHQLAAQACLRAYSQTENSWSEHPLLDYAKYWWHTHYSKVDAQERSNETRALLVRFCFRDSLIAPTFRMWRSSMRHSNQVEEPSCPFYLACMYGFTEILEYYTTHPREAAETFSLFCDTQRDLYFGYYGIHMAISCGHHNAVEYLLRNGWSSSAYTEQGETSLYVAAQWKRPRIMDLLLVADADPNEISTNPDDVYGEVSPGEITRVIDMNCGAAIHEVARNEDTECLEVLLAHSADINVKTLLGFTALHLAVWKGHRQMVEKLVTSGADINPAPISGWTPLHEAASSGQADIVSLLLQHGADPKIRDCKMSTAGDIATRHGHSTTLAASLGSSYVMDPAGPILPLHPYEDTSEFNIAQRGEEMDTELDKSLDTAR